MPTYEYKCDNCGHTFEEFQSMIDAPLEKCPKCGGKIQRLIGAGAGLIFKGSGFYLTDYKKSNSSPAASSGEAKPGQQSGTDPSKSKSDKIAKPKAGSREEKKAVTAKSESE